MDDKIGIQYCIMVPESEYQNDYYGDGKIYSGKYIACQRLISFLYEYGYLDDQESYILDSKSNGKGHVLFTINFDEMYKTHPEIKNYIKISIPEKTLNLISELIN